MVTRHLKAVEASEKSGAVELTTAHIKALRARSDASEVRIGDSIEPGLYLRRDPRKGSVGFIYRGRIRGAEGAPIRKLKLDIKPTDAKSIAKARAQAAEIRSKLAAGIDPSAERRVKAAEIAAATQALADQQQREAELRRWTPAFAVEHLIEWRAARPDASLHFRPETIEYYRRAIAYLGKLAKVPIIDLRADAIRKALDAIDGVAKPAKAKRALSAVINHTIKRLELNIANPVTRLDRGEFKAPKARTSYIAEGDIGMFVGKAASLPGMPELRGKLREAERARDYLLLALLYGTRKEELMRMEWSWIDWIAGTITLPASLTKQRRNHLLPLTDWTRAILKKRFDARKPEVPFVFPGQKKGKPLTNVRRTMVRAYGEGFMLHDFRRTLITHCASLGIHGTRLKALVGHARSGVTEGYDQREIEQTRRDLTKYHEWLRDKHADWELTQAELAYDATPDGQAQGAFQAEQDAAYETWAAQQPVEPAAPHWPGL